MDAAYKFAKYLIGTGYKDLPEEVVEATKKEILDLLGVAIGGFSEPGAREVFEIVKEQGGKEESSLIGSIQKVPAPNAAQANVTMAHSLDYDDVHESAVMHPGVAIIPVCLAVGERKGDMSGKEFITCAALGVDMMCRLALATTPGESPVKMGWHLTTLFGFFGSAGVSGRIMGFGEETMVNAMGIAYHQCCGNGQAVQDGALTKRLGPGFSVRGGITAALMAQKGVTGANNCLEGELGLYNLYMKGKYDPQILTSDLGKRFEGVNVAIKPYPCCRGVHPAIDSALELNIKNDIRVEDISTIKISVSEAHQFLLCTPLDVRLKPRNTVDAQFSIPWGVATALVRNRVILEDFTPDSILNGEILGVTEKVEIERDDSLNRDDKVDPTRVRAIMKQGDIFSAQVEDTLGSIKRPMSFDNCADKFMDCAKRFEKDRREKIIDIIGNLEDVGDISELIRLLAEG